ncbi:MAG: hypothetical protein ABL878_00880 [Burkholderiales bacterium]
MSIKIKRHLQACYPIHADLLGKVATVPKLCRRDMPLPEAVVRVVTGQMLSSKAAQSIYERVNGRAVDLGLPGSWLLDQESLRACGLSGSKAKTIAEFGREVGSDSGDCGNHCAVLCWTRGCVSPRRWQLAAGNSSA